MRLKSLVLVVFLLQAVISCRSPEDRMRSIDALQVAGKVDEAVNELSVLLEETPEDAELQLR